MGIRGKCFGIALRPPGMFFLVCFDLRGALLMGLIRRGNRGQHLGLVEQQRLIGVDGCSVFLLGDRAEVLRLDPAQLLLQQYHPLAVASTLGPQLFDFFLERFELTQALRRDQITLEKTGFPACSLSCYVHSVPRHDLSHLPEARLVEELQLRPVVFPHAAGPISPREVGGMRLP
jgi:hypothetical protein